MTNYFTNTASFIFEITPTSFSLLFPPSKSSHVPTPPYFLSNSWAHFSAIVVTCIQSYFKDVTSSQMSLEISG